MSTWLTHPHVQDAIVGSPHVVVKQCKAQRKLSGLPACKLLHPVCCGTSKGV